MTEHITQELKDLIIKEFTESLVPAAKIAERIGYTRQGVYKILKRAGVDIKQSAFIQTVCHTCGNQVSKRRCKARVTTKTFCSDDCYYAWLAAGGNLHETPGDYIPNRQGQRYARFAVSKHFELKPGYVVHHEDRDNTNNQLWNLRVFSSNSDHIKYHRGLSVKPIWDGSIL